MSPPETVFYDLADGAAVLEYPSASDEEANRAAVALAEALQSSGIDGLLDAIPGARTLSLTFDPERLPPQDLRREALSRAAQSDSPGPARAVSVDVLYGGEMGPDLPDLASGAGRTPGELVRRHAAGDYTVAFLGFAPGFAYLTGLDPALHAARLPAPRPRVAAGSVGIGGPYTGIYPSATPGGWRLIGRAAIRLFDEDADPPNLLRPGDRVRFEAVSAARFQERERELTAAARSETSPGGRPVLRVVKPGLFTSIQAAPRFGRGAAGLPPGGAMDGRALIRGNARLGNAPGAAALEMTLLGPDLEAMADVAVCVCGPAAIERNGIAITAASAFRLAAGDRLRCGPAREAARAYLCVEGGFAIAGGLGLTRPIEAGQILMRETGGRASKRGADPEPAGVGEASGPLPKEIVLRVVLDPRRERFFDAGAVTRFFESAFRVSSTSDRRGLRLEGPPLPALGSSEVPPEGTALGTIQVPPNGQPILLGPDRPITGGYARLGVVISADWPLVASSQPGRRVRFAAVTLAEAVEARSTIWKP